MKNFIVFADDSEVEHLRSVYSRFDLLECLPTKFDPPPMKPKPFEEWIEYIEKDYGDYRIAVLIVPFSKRSHFSMGFKLENSQSIFTDLFASKMLSGQNNMFGQLVGRSIRYRKAITDAG